MARLTYQEVEEAARGLLRDNRYPSVAAVRQALGHGSDGTVHRHLKTFWGKLGESMAAPALEGMPEDLVPLLRQLWEAALAAAAQRFDEQRAVCESQAQAASERAEAAEQVSTDLSTRLSDKDAQIESLMAARDALSAQLQQARDETAATAKALEQLQQRHAQLGQTHQDDRRRMAGRLRSLLHRNRDLSRRLESAGHSHGEAIADERARFEAQEAHWLRLLDEARQESRQIRNKAKRDQSRLEGALEKLQADLRQSHEDLRARDEQWQQQLDAMRDTEREHRSALAQTIGALREQIRALQAQNAALERTVSALRPPNDDGHSKS